MALLNLADIPEEVATFEQLTVWCFGRLARLAQGRTLPVGEQGARVAAASMRLIEAGDGRLYARCEAFPPCSLEVLNLPEVPRAMAAGALVGAVGALPEVEPPPPPPPPPTDPLFSSVSVLLHFEGVNGGSSFPDSGPLGLATTPTRVTTSTDAPLVGAASGLFLGTSTDDWSQLDIQGGAHFVFPGDFTIEVTVDLNYSQTYTWRTLFELGDYTNGILFRDDAIYVNGSARWFDPGFIAAKPRKILLQRKEGILSYYFDGVRQRNESGPFASTVNTSAAGMRLGGARHTGLQHLRMKCDELRVTKGHARTAGNYQPGADPFPDQ